MSASLTPAKMDNAKITLTDIHAAVMLVGLVLTAIASKTTAHIIHVITGYVKTKLEVTYAPVTMDTLVEIVNQKLRICQLSNHQLKPQNSPHHQPTLHYHQLKLQNSLSHPLKSLQVVMIVMTTTHAQQKMQKMDDSIFQATIQQSLCSVVSGVNAML